MNCRFDVDSVFFTSDTRFYHTHIIECCKLLFKSLEDMNETLIANWKQAPVIEPPVGDTGQGP